jgi:hypothetical protein
VVAARIFALWVRLIVRGADADAGHHWNVRRHRCRFGAARGLDALLQEAIGVETLATFCGATRAGLAGGVAELCQRRQRLALADGLVDADLADEIGAVG